MTFFKISLLDMDQKLQAKRFNTFWLNIENDLG